MQTPVSADTYGSLVPHQEFCLVPPSPFYLMQNMCQNAHGSCQVGAGSISLLLGEVVKDGVQLGRV